MISFWYRFGIGLDIVILAYMRVFGERTWVSVGRPIYRPAFPPEFFLLATATFFLTCNAIPLKSACTLTTHVSLGFGPISF